MAPLIDYLEKRIYQNKPTDDTNNQYQSYGQYNYGRVDIEDAYSIMGIASNNLNGDSDLYTVVFEKPFGNAVRFPNGYMNGLGTPEKPSYIKFHHVHSSTRYGDTDSGYYYDGQYALWMYDGYESHNAGTNASGTWNGSNVSSVHAIGQNISADKNKGTDIRFGLIGKDGDKNYQVYKNDNAINSSGDPLDGKLWENLTPGHLLGSRALGHTDSGFGLVDELYNTIKGRDFACGGWSTAADSGISGWYNWNKSLPLEYCVGRYQYSLYSSAYSATTYPSVWGGMYGGGQYEGTTDEANLAEWLLDTGTYGTHPYLMMGCRWTSWSDDDDCGLDGVCEDETQPFYCGPGLALETTGYSDSDRTFTRGYPNDVDKEGTNRVDNFHLGWQDREGFRYNPPLNQIGPDRLIEDGYHFSDYVRGIVPTETPENIIYMIALIGGDEREKLWGFEGVHDERDHQYARMNIPKNYLYEIWKNQKGEVRTFNFHYNLDGGDRSKGHSSWLAKMEFENGWGGHSRANAYRDDWGESRGYDAPMPNNMQPITRLEHIRIKVKAPTFDPLISIKPLLEGGMNSNWINSTKIGWWCIDDIDIGSGRPYRRGLNPRYDMDFIGFPNSYYGASNSLGENVNGDKYFDGALTDFRPISYIQSIANDEVDLQGYYEGNSTNDNLAKIYSSAPNDVKLQFKLAEPGGSSTPTIIDDLSVPPYDNFKYWFFVVNWDWQEGEPGGGECESATVDIDCISEISQNFPLGDFELENLNQEDLFKIITLSDEVNPNTGESYDTFAQHQYLTPGVKIIKALVFSTTEMSDDYWGNDWCVDKPCEDYSGFFQAVRWKLATIKINLNGEGTFPSPDFGDLGGDDFVYLPMPSVINIDYQGNAPSGNTYKSSHAVISGLSEDSQYVTSIDEIYRQDSFTLDEIDEKNTMLRARNSSPIGNLDEIGDYLGNSDLSQIRYFNKVCSTFNDDGTCYEPLDMRKLLLLDGSVDENMNTIALDGSFHPYYDFDYWTGNPSFMDGNNLIDAEPTFPKESPVGDIFINGYEQFKEDCLFELNLGDIDGKTIKDTNGNGNKGILVGDYSIKKEPGSPATRDSYIKVSEKGTENGAF